MKRKRNNQMIIRLTDKELSEFNKKMKEAKSKSRADFVMALVRDRPIIIPDPFREIAVELKREGNNFNQALKMMRVSGSPPWKMKISTEKLDELYSKIAEMLDEVA